MATSEEKLKLKEWEEYIAAVASATAMEERLSEGEKIKKLAWLEDRPEEWMLYFSRHTPAILCGLSKEGNPPHYGQSGMVRSAVVEPGAGEKYGGDVLCDVSGAD